MLLFSFFFLFLHYLIQLLVDNASLTLPTLCVLTNNTLLPNFCSKYALWIQRAMCRLNTLCCYSVCDEQDNFFLFNVSSTLSPFAHFYGQC